VTTTYTSSRTIEITADTLARPVGVRIAAPGRYGWDEEDDCRERDEPEREEAREAVERALPACDERGAEDESRLPITLPESDPRTTSVRPSFTAMSAMMSSGAFPKVALRKAADARARVLRRVLRRLPDQPRERDERDGRQDELDRLRRVHEVVQHDGDRRERERSEEGLAHHGLQTLPTSRCTPAGVATA
jgi:hypothetical protein